MRLNLRNLVENKKIQNIFISNNGWQGMAMSQFSQKFSIEEIENLRQDLENRYDSIQSFIENNKKSYPQVCHFLDSLRDKTIDYYWMYELSGSQDFLFNLIDQNKSLIHEKVNKETMKESILFFIEKYKKTHKELRQKSALEMKKFLKNPLLFINLN